MVTPKPHFPPVDFRLVSHTLATELRYIAAIKTTRMRWHEPEYICNVLRGAIELAVKYNIGSLLEFPLPPADIKNSASRLEAMFPGQVRTAITGDFALAIVGMRRLLDEATADLSASNVWHPSEFDLSGRINVVADGLIYWTKMECLWLREGLKTLAREHLRSGSRAWGTIGTYVRAGSIFSRYLNEEIGQIEPADMSREVFLDFVAWVRDEDSTETDLHAVNTLARLLNDLKIEGIVPELPETVFLRRGENAIPKTRHPKPFPADILEAIDRLLADETAMPPAERLILRLFRAVGPRASEALMLPNDAVTYTDGRGYTLEYFQSKIQDWRRVPLPPKLGGDLVRQKLWVARTYGPSCKWMFPYAGRRPRTNSVVNPDGPSPWPFARFRNFVWGLYREHGIVGSAITGETLNGAHLHRFRHSIATGLLNEGWSQYEVQTFLGHKSPTMMQAYAEINDDKLRDKYLEFINKSVDIDGQNVEPPDNATVDVERLRDRFIRSTLPNGFCTLPEKQKCEFLPSPCLSCTFFRTTRTFLPVHIRQRDEAIRELDIAEADGRQRAAEAHASVVTRLDTIIDGLNQVPDDEEDCGDD